MPMMALARHKLQFYAYARPCAVGVFFFIAFAFCCLVYLFWQSDFSVLYVAKNSATSLPLFYRLAAVWGGHEGSLLLWILVITSWTFILIYKSQRIPEQFLATVLAVIGLMNVGFLWFLLQTSSPFVRTLPNVPFDGLDLNPILQDPGLVIHPPMLYLGYVGFAITFAFAIAGLLTKNIHSKWACWVRPWALLSWLALTLGIVLGSWWSYHVLGWGGWWVWDPVENASFLPWLLGTALIHCLMVMEKRNQLYHWTILLAILTYTMSLIGTFLVRSGVLISVHAFANDPARGIFLLKYLFILISVSLVLYAIRAKQWKSTDKFFILSRESFLLLANILLVVMTASIALGTLYPLLIDSLGLGKLSVGEPYFNAIFVPLTILLLILMSVGIYSGWYKTNWQYLKIKLIKTVIISFLLTILILFLLGEKIHFLEALGVFLGVCVIVSTLTKIKYYQGKIYALSVVFAHVGIGVITLAIAISANTSEEQAVRMDLTETVLINDYAVQFNSLQSIQGDNYEGISADFSISKHNKIIKHVQSKQKQYTVTKTWVAEPAIFASIYYDLYIVLGNQYPDETWMVRIYYKPFIRWIWLGGLLVFLGGLLALFNGIKLKLINSCAKERINKND